MNRLRSRGCLALILALAVLPAACGDEPVAEDAQPEAPAEIQELIEPVEDPDASVIGPGAVLESITAEQAAPSTCMAVIRYWTNQNPDDYKSIRTVYERRLNNELAEFHIEALNYTYSSAAPDRSRIGEIFERRIESMKALVAILAATLAARAQAPEACAEIIAAEFEKELRQSLEVWGGS